MDNDDWHDLRADGRARMADIIAETISKLDALKYPEPTARTDHSRLSDQMYNSWLSNQRISNQSMYNSWLSAERHSKFDDLSWLIG